MTTAENVHIFIPVFGGAQRLTVCLSSLGRFSPANRVTVLDDATPGDEVLRVTEEFRSALPHLSYLRNAENRGFVKNCNRAAADLRPDEDLLLLNSDTEVTDGFLAEMHVVLHSDPCHAVVAPRSNDASLLSVPLTAGVSAPQSYSLWLRVKDLLPPYQLLPTSVGFCMLVRGGVVRELGLFDDAYSPGYNEENDLVCRLNRLGYASVAANRAFVYHHRGSSFGHLAAQLEQRNRKLLIARYPEYERTIPEYFRHGIDPIEHFATLFEDHTPRVLYDLTHLDASQSEAAEFGLELLGRIAGRLEARADLYVAVQPDTHLRFAALLAGFACLHPARLQGQLFDIVFRPAPICKREDFIGLGRLGLRMSFALPDVRGLRYPTSAEQRAVLATAAETADCVVALKRLVASAYERVAASARVITIPFGAALLEPPALRQGHILVLGEGADEAALRAADELRKAVPVTVLADQSTYRVEMCGVTWHDRSELTRPQWRALLERSAIAVAPGIITGYCCSVLDAIQAGVPVWVHRQSDLAGVDGLLVFDNLDEITTPAHSMTFVGQTSPWDQVAAGILSFLTKLLEHEPDVARLRARWSSMRALEAPERLT